VISIAADILFPCFCVSCGSFVLSGNNNICQACASSIEILSEGCPICCGIVNKGKCTICEERKFYPDKNFIIFEYKNVVMDAVHALKFKGIRNVYKALIPFLKQKLNEIEHEIDLITYVPMQYKKIKKRGYNQSELFASAMAAEWGKPAAGILMERKNSGVQRDLNYTERFINVIDRYEIKDKFRIKGKNILIIDDVFTTGATLNECARCLKNAGAERVFTCAIARSDIRKPESI
jgi:ComF family protein